MRKTSILRDQRGSGLLEAVLAVAVLGTTAAAVLAGLSTGSLAVNESQTRVVANQLALSQVEYLKNLEYEEPPTSYATVTPPSPDFTLSASAVEAENDENLSLVTITVSLNGQPYLTLTTYKVNR